MFSGESPTKPWTDVCIAHRTGQRISGPLFFGFSDAVTQRAIAANLYSDAELRAALQVRVHGPGRVAEQRWPAAALTPCTPRPRCHHTLQGERIEVSAAATPQERAAHEFMSVEGIGEATAIALSKTVALGGAAHGGLASLRDWAGAAGERRTKSHACTAGGWAQIACAHTTLLPCPPRRRQRAAAARLPDHQQRAVGRHTALASMAPAHRAQNCVGTQRALVRHRPVAGGGRRGRRSGRAGAPAGAAAAA